MKYSPAVSARPVLRFLPTRLALFFLAAVLLPAGFLVFLTLRILVQEQELLEKRTADERSRLASDVRRELLSRVERLRLTADSSAGREEPLPKEVALHAFVVSGQLVLPWESSSGRTASVNRSFDAAIAAGEQLEFIGAEPVAAADVYRRAATLARSPAQRAAAELLVARALTKSHDTRAATTRYRGLLGSSPAMVDDQGVPFAFYAMRALRRARSLGPDDAAVGLAAIEATLSRASSAPAAIYMARDELANMTAQGGPSRDRLDAATALTARRISDAGQALELQRTLGASTLASRDASLEVWAPFGPAGNLWLVHVASVEPRTVTAVRADAVVASLAAQRVGSVSASVVVSTARDGVSLAPEFPGLTLVVAPHVAAALANAGGPTRAFYLAALALVVSVAFFGGLLFWRDVRREVRVAELRSQFVSSVSHELKTPLTAIRMFAETLLLGRSRPGGRHEYLETIVNESERLTRLLDNVLDFSKIEQGSKTYRLEPQSLPDVVSVAVKAMQYPAAQQGFELRVVIDEDIPPVNADADGILQAVLNLLGNAMKYSGDSRVIELRVGRSGSAAVLSVTDFGIGIPIAEQSRIFEKFYRVRDDVTRRVPGTGLGLALVDHVARAHGGQVTVVSAPGRGSTFAMILPLLPT